MTRVAILVAVWSPGRQLLLPQRVAMLTPANGDSPNRVAFRIAARRKSLAGKQYQVSPQTWDSSRRPGEPATWRRETGRAPFERPRVRDARGPESSGCRLAGELIDAETVTISSEGGGWKRAQPVLRKDL